MNIKAWELEEFIGTDFFVRNGTDEPIKVGKLVGYQTHENSGSALPLVEMEGETYISFSTMLPYSKELEIILKSMTPQEQLNFMVKIKHFVSADNRECYGRKKG
jgi:hypothetical protein